MGTIYVSMIMFVIGVNLCVITYSLVTDTLYEYKKKHAVEEWKKFFKLKKKMAVYLTA